ncbi:MAG TPA: ABC transporter permease [Gemmatimonadaceae bacterium]|nr:ABC transporter permease [Gemmatimonadaceae bacterium]
MRRPPGALLLALGAGAGAILLLAVLLHLSGYDATLAMRALWTGSVGSWYALGSATLVRATPLILAGLAVALAFRAGIWNIGAEGQLVVGAAAAAAAGLAWTPALGRAVLPVELLLGAVAGAAWAGIAAFLRRRFGVLEVISTIMLNFLAIHGVSWLVRGPMQEPLRIYPQTPSLAEAARMPRIIEGARVHWGWVLAMALAPLLWWAMRATAAGFRARAAGASPGAARNAGEIDVARTGMRAFLASGALAGLAGAIEVTGVTYALYENLSPGYGYTAIAVALLARLDLLGVILSGTFFAALESGALAMQREASVPAVVVSVVEAVLILAVLVAWRGLPGPRAMPAEEGA